MLKASLIVWLSTEPCWLTLDFLLFRELEQHNCGEHNRLVKGGWPPIARGSSASANQNEQKHPKNVGEEENS